MKHHSSILICLTGILLAACWPGKHSSKAKQKSFQHPFLIAWNEDSVHSYQLLITNNRQFLYSITNKDSTQPEGNYQGTILSRITSDTIFLRYKKNNQPKDVTSYLIREISGNYLIQPFLHSEKRIFMRIQHWGERF